MHESVRRLKIAVLIVLPTLWIIPGLFAAGNGEEVRGEVTISMWTHDALYSQYFRKRVDALNARNPDRRIIFEIEEMPNTINSFISAYVAREELPDMIGAEQGWFPILMEDDVIEDVMVDLTELIGERYSDFVEGRWALYTHKEAIYGVESALTAVVYYYQPELFERYGVELPETWNEFVSAGRELAENGVSIGIMDDNSGGLFSMMFLQRGGQFFDRDANLVFDEGENRRHAVAVLEILRELIDAGALLDVLGNEFWGSTIPSAFASGRAAGIVAPDWYNTSLLQPGSEQMSGQWRAAPMPIWTDTPGSFSTSVWGGTGFMITRASEYPEIVWEIIDDGYMTLEGQLDRYDTIGFYPTMYEALGHPEVTEQEHPFFGGQRIGEVFSAVALDTPPLWQSPARPFLLDSITANMPRFIAGELTPEGFVDQVAADTESGVKL